MNVMEWRQTRFVALLVLHWMTHYHSMGVILQDTVVPMTVDGWRPIVGRGREPSFTQEITHYRNPNSHTSETVRAAEGGMSSIKPTAAKMQQYYVLPNHGHGPHIPLAAVTVNRPQTKKYPLLHVTTVSNGNKRGLSKPLTRLQTPAHSIREEVYAAPGSSGSSYAFYTHVVNPSKILRDPHYAINHPQLEVPSRYVENTYPKFSGSHNNNNAPIQGYIFPKHPLSNDINYHHLISTPNIDYTRNLVPPPPLIYAKHKEKSKIFKSKEKGEGVLSTTVKQNQNQNQQQTTAVHHQRPTYDQRAKQQNKPFKDNIKAYEINESASYVDDSELDALNIRKPAMFPHQHHQNKHPYEVTEVGSWAAEDQETHSIKNPKPAIKTQPHQLQVELNVQPFLPTPYKPDSSMPISEPTIKSNSNQFFSIKEVSTHYPVMGLPNFVNNEEKSTKGQLEIQEIFTQPITEAPKLVLHRKPSTSSPRSRKRPINRTKTTTTKTTPAKSEESDEYVESGPNEADLQNNKGTHQLQKHRSTTFNDKQHLISTTVTPFTKTKVKSQQKGRLKHSPTQKMPENHKTVAISEYEMTQATSLRNSEDEAISNTNETNQEKQHVRNHIIEAEINESFEDVTNIGPDNKIEELEIDLSMNNIASSNNKESTSSVSSSSTIPTTTISPTTTDFVKVTTEVDAIISTTKLPPRTRSKPIKYDASNRPKFSVKDYRQRLSTSTSATTNTTPAAPSIAGELLRMSNNVTRPKYHQQRVKRPFTLASSTNPTTSSYYTVKQEEITIESRPKFIPKEPRHGLNINDDNENRRPNYNRVRSSTSTSVARTTTPRVSIKPNLFVNRRRPPSVTLKTRILSKHNKTHEMKTASNNNDILLLSEHYTETTATSDYGVKRRSTTTPISANTVPISDDETTTDILKHDALIYSQRVSDLTSSSKNDYNIPGMFKAVAPTSRRIPNYFTISTDDPILPIEAFFSNIKDTTKTQSNTSI